MGDFENCHKKIGVGWKNQNSITVNLDDVPTSNRLVLVPINRKFGGSAPDYEVYSRI